MDQNHSDLTISSWEWAPGRHRSFPSHCGAALETLLPLKYSAQPAHDFHSSLKRELPAVDLEPECTVLAFHQTSPSSSLLSPLCISPGFDTIHLFQSDGLQSGFERSGVSPQSLPAEDEALSPLDWTAGRRNLLASPFSEDSDSDDGLAPSPFSSPESSGKPETDEEIGCLFCPPSAQDRTSGYHHLGQYPSLDSFHDLPDYDPSLSQFQLSPTSIPGRSPSPSRGIEEGLQSPSLSPAPLPGSSSSYYFDHQPPSHIPGSPLPNLPRRYHAVDLPTLENEIDSRTDRFGLGLHSADLSYPFRDFYIGDEVPPPRGISQRTTWLSLPGADTDDDLIPAELGSKTYIPDPSITIPTTPPARSLLIWDPTTRSGLPIGLPSFDGTGRRLTTSLDVDALPIGRPHSQDTHSQDEDFDVDPALIAKLAEKDAEKCVEVQKLCKLKQRTNIAATIASKGREGAQLDVERVREKWREVTALLRLKLTSDEETVKTKGDIDDARECIPSGGTENDGSSPSSASLLLSHSISSPTSTPEALTTPSSHSSTSDCSSSSTSPQAVRRHTSKPKITSMAQLVANMVFHRQDALRRSPARSRTWSPVASVTHTTASVKARSWTQTSPTSPLRQMILPEDLDSEGDVKSEPVLDSPLQLSPLCLAFRGSPECFYAQLESPPSVSLSTS